MFHFVPNFNVGNARSRRPTAIARELRRFTVAVLAAAETAADFAGILYTDAPAGGEADAAEPIELEKRALLSCSR